MGGGTLSGAPWGNGTVNAQSLYGANAPGAPSPMQATATAAHAGGGALDKQLFGIQLPVLLAIGALAWWAWREYD